MTYQPFLCSVFLNACARATLVPGSVWRMSFIWVPNFSCWVCVTNSLFILACLWLALSFGTLCGDLTCVYVTSLGTLCRDLICVCVPNLSCRVFVTNLISIPASLRLALVWVLCVEFWFSSVTNVMNASVCLTLIFGCTSAWYLCELV